MHRTTTNHGWRDHTDRESREAAILTDLVLDPVLAEVTGGEAEPPF